MEKLDKLKQEGKNPFEITKFNRTHTSKQIIDNYDELEGKDVTIAATGIMVDTALEAKDLLAAEGINAKIVNIHTLKPLDNELLIQCAKETGAIVTVEEHSVIGGLGSAVAEVIAEEYPVPVVKLGVNDVFGQSGTPAELLKGYGLTAEGIVEKVKKALALKR